MSSKKRRKEMFKLSQKKAKLENAERKKNMAVPRTLNVADLLASTESVPDLLLRVLQHLADLPVKPLEYRFALTVDEMQIVDALWKINETRLPTLLPSLIKILPWLLESKYKAPPEHLCSWTRVLVALSRRLCLPHIPLRLAGVLLKSRTYRQVHRVVCVAAALWPEIFREASPGTATEYLEAISFGVSQMSKKEICYVERVAKECLVPVPARYIQQPEEVASGLLARFLEVCNQPDSEASSEDEFRLSTCLCVLGVYSDVEWTQQHLLRPISVVLFQSCTEESKRRLFAAHIHLFVDISLKFVTKPDPSLKHFFEHGSPSVRIEAGLAITRFYLRSRSLVPRSFALWFEENGANPRLEAIRPEFFIRAMKENSGAITRQDLEDL